jgi:hypothetical protein
MGFFMADVRPALPTESAEDQRLVPELLKGHLHLGVSAIAMIDLDDYIFGSQNRLYQGIPLVVSGGGGALRLVYIAATSSGPGRSVRSRRLLRFALIMTPQGLVWI